MTSVTKIFNTRYILTSIACTTTIKASTKLIKSIWSYEYVIYLVGIQWFHPVPGSTVGHSLSVSPRLCTQIIHLTRTKAREHHIHSPSLPPWNLTRIFFSRNFPSSALRRVSFLFFSGGGAWTGRESEENGKSKSGVKRKNGNRWGSGPLNEVRLDSMYDLPRPWIIDIIDNVTGIGNETRKRIINILAYVMILV